MCTFGLCDIFMFGNNSTTYHYCNMPKRKILFRFLDFRIWRSCSSTDSMKPMSISQIHSMRFFNSTRWIAMEFGPWLAVAVPAVFWQFPVSLLLGLVTRPVLQYQPLVLGYLKHVMYCILYKAEHDVLWLLWVVVSAAVFIKSNNNANTGYTVYILVIKYIFITFQGNLKSLYISDINFFILSESRIRSHGHALVTWAKWLWWCMYWTVIRTATCLDYVLDKDWTYHLLDEF